MIGYYVHHQGLGHVTRARGIGRELARRGVGVVAFSSLVRPDDWTGEWVRLPTDETNTPFEPTAGGVLHWAPLGHEGLGGRMRAIAERLPDLCLVVVDVSVEVALLARLFGVPTVVVAMRGDRSDRPHLAAYDSACTLLAPWEQRFADQGWPAHWSEKTHFVGAMSRFDDLEPPATRARAGRRVLGVWGGGGTDLPAGAVQAARAATPGWDWVWRSPADPSPDLWADLHGCDVVVCHAGNNALAEVASARRPAVVVAQPRPFDEQRHAAAAIRRAGLAVALDEWPEPDTWPQLLDEARRRGGEGWKQWNRRDGAGRAAEALAHLAARVTP
ncbi:hypothetical protein FOJ82_01900 [Tessaracoccus rhinocerotis]|uniref:Glycosyl transferase family 28 C-terminal domain-containing protein n=1 Tax=Tessaracoccus rhinocerotis TaxID=1689449 RepID=A0A553K4N8_9ACTN|nr:glycosyltransferase [Tessaracoccus rhinocerotis]TRY19664.1 hypothetical protein FOJ82_01900 [Tessaracoccus rhinocerotis]